VLRLIGFFVLAVLLASLLGHLPLVGPFFRHTGLLGVFVAAALLSFGLGRLGETFVRTRRLRAELQALGAVDSAHNRGKLGALLLAHGRAGAARAHLAAAVAGEPDSAEWRYRLGLAELAAGDPSAALAAFEACVARAEGHAYGQALLRQAECLQRLGRSEEALGVLARHERNHGESPEVLYRRGRTLARLGRKAEARAALARVGELAAQATRYQRAAARGWALRAALARYL